MISSPNGNDHVSCAPNAELYQSGSSPSALNSSPPPRLTRIEGLIRLATVSVHSGPDPRKGRRNAMPPASDTTTVATTTVVANAKDRVSDPAKSPTACASTSRPNQCTDSPFIGNVSPPSGPWND